MINTYRSLRATLHSVAFLALLGAGSGAVMAGQAHKTKVTTSKAESAALKKYAGGKIQGKTALEKEDGKWQYAVLVKVGGKMHEVMVDANTGKINSEETVTAKEEAAEKKADEAAKKGGKAKHAVKSNKG